MNKKTLLGVCMGTLAVCGAAKSGIAHAEEISPQIKTNSVYVVTVSESIKDKSNIILEKQILLSNNNPYHTVSKFSENYFLKDAEGDFVLTKEGDPIIEYGVELEFKGYSLINGNYASMKINTQTLVNTDDYLNSYKVSKHDKQGFMVKDTILPEMSSTFTATNIELPEIGKDLVVSKGSFKDSDKQTLVTIKRVK
ncbi:MULTISPECIES: hypothetical protein [Vibrio harveyi group]|uniref:hypothetical protein n=1 Tax=Vibrio harveyi group TaxID=717610 RepID=UPI0006A5F22E|nr:hypothetical protein [Vibrio diabolicus]KOE92750.1 hypothetical protein ACS91_01660 [Vibrio parahaemolyticus]MCS0310703.1 hypothetical protein [Vibrio diabolicus]